MTGSLTVDTNDYQDPKAVKTFAYTVSWTFRRCSPPLIITDVKFFQPLYPFPNSWNEIKSDGHAVDGNQVKVVATVANLSGETKYPTVQFKELKENVVLPDGQVSISIQPGEQREVEYLWDTNG